MTLRLSTALRDYVNAHGSMKDALHNGEIKIYTGAQPASADSAPSGTLLVTITAASAARTAEVLATGSVTLTGGAAGSIDTLTVDSVSIIDAAVPYNTSLSQTATDLATAINNCQTHPNYKASASGAVVTISAMRGTGAAPNGFVVASTVTTITKTDANMASGVAAVNGLKLGVSTDGVLAKLASQVWSGVAADSGTAGWFRFTGGVADSGVGDTDDLQVRLDGAISTSGAQLNMSSTTITAAATQTIASFPLTLPAS